MYVMTAPPPQDLTDPSAARAAIDRTALLAAALASAGAGLVHAAAAGSHNDSRGLSVLFAVVAAVQLGWAALAVARPRVPTAVAGVVLNGSTVVAWILAHTVGIPVIAMLRDIEAVGAQDTLAAVLGAGAAMGAAAAVLLGARPATTAGPAAPATAAPRTAPALAPLAIAGALVAALAVPGMAAPHSHGAGHAHGDEVAAGADPTGGPSGHDEHGTGHDDHGMDHGDGQAMPGMDHGGGRRIISIDDPRLTPEQRRRARDVLDRTLKGIAALTDEASVVAAGYETIGDAASGFEHFINHRYTGDGIEMDPARVESIVFDTKPGRPKKLAAAMYILEEPKRMGDEPEIAGSLTTWHLHADLCWDPSYKRVLGVFRQNRCLPAGELHVTPPMLHVWREPQPCGPFAEAETDNVVDRAINRGSTTTRAPDADPCQHEHNGQH
jgi:hypothetical protein